MALKFKCPDCSEEIVTKYCKIGEVIKCNKCGAEFAIPENVQQTDKESTLISRTVTVNEEKVERICDSEYQIAKGRRYPGICQAIWLLILIGLLVFALSFIALIVEHIINYPLSKHPAAMAITYLVAIVFVLKIGFDKTKAIFKNVFPLSSTQTSLLIPMIITLMGFTILQAEMNNLISMFIPGAEVVAKHNIELVNQSYWGAVLALVVVAPFTEELLFRGIILRGFLNRYKVSEAIMVSALLFGVIHLNIFQFLGAFFIGILFAWWFVKTRSLLPCIFGHVLNNAFIVILIIMIRPNISNYTEPAQFGPLWFDMLGILCLISGIWLSARMFKKTNNIPANPKR